MRFRVVAAILAAIPAVVTACPDHMPKHPSVKAPKEASVKPLELRIAETEASDATVEMPVKGSRLSVHVRKEAAVPTLRIAGADVVGKDDARAEVRVRLTPEAGAELAKVARANVGKRLVVLFEGAAVSAAEIDETFAAAKDLLVVPASADDAKRIARKLNESAGKP